MLYGWQGKDRAKRVLMHVLAGDDRGHAYLDACMPSDLASEALLDQVSYELTHLGMITEHISLLHVGHELLQGHRHEGAADAGRASAGRLRRTKPKHARSRL